jgi:hypothetical protein
MLITEQMLTILSQALDTLLSNRAYTLLLTAPSLLLAYLAHRTTHGQTLWRVLLAEVAKHPEAATDTLGILVGGEAREAVEGLTAVDAGSELAGTTSSADSAGTSTSTPSSPEGPLDALFAAISPLPVPVPTPLLAQVLQRGELFLSPIAWHGALARVVSAFAARVEAALVSPVPAPAAAPLSFSTFDADLQLLASVLAGRPEAAAADARALLPALWVFAYVLPLTVPPEEREADAVGVARNIWLQWREEGEDGARAEVVEEVKRRLGVLVCSTDVCVTCVPPFFLLLDVRC